MLSAEVRSNALGQHPPQRQPLLPTCCPVPSPWSCPRPTCCSCHMCVLSNAVTHLNTREDGLVGHYCVLKDRISGAACVTLFRDTEQGGKNEAKGFCSSLHTQIQHIRINSQRNTSCFECEGSFSCPAAHLLGAQPCTSSAMGSKAPAWASGPNNPDLYPCNQFLSSH